MSYENFNDDEAGFMDWQNCHPDGVFVNSRPGRLSPSYIVAHKANCTSVARHIGRATVYSKHCFDSLSEAQEYLVHHYGKQPSIGCTVCRVGMLKNH
ncbi:hypothetical protein ACF3NX_01855 [Acetobacter orientalis]|uniref:hypothetical protein n=1 Tax=Acetobacter orientalis TaxID=146474 RepID=UPI003868430D